MAMGTCWATDSWAANSWAEGAWADLSNVTNLSVLSLDLGGLSKSIIWKGNILPVTVLTAAPTGDAPSDKGVVFYIEDGLLKVAGWNGSAWVTSDAGMLALNGTELRIGGASNYTAFEADGTLEANGDAVVWDDLRINPGAFDRPGSNDPSPVAYAPNGGGLTIQLYEFAVDDYACFTVQIPHNYKTGTDIYAHVHWTPGARGNEENGKFVGWKLDYTWANIDGTFGDMATLDLKDACDGTDHKHQMTADVVIDGHTAAKGVSSMLLCTIKRTDTGADDDWVSTTGGQLPMILEIDFHYQIDTIGSRERTSK